jgi:transcriptional regulator with PAS, ATPase and Fis domain
VKIASVDACALITGETGTGKELAARAIHQLSSRRDRPFVAINCVSLPPSLIHAELFGFEKGAFTGAHQRKVGHIEAARGGTIFLDEVGDLHADLQALLLRFLEEQTVRRVGGRDEIHVDAPVLAATNVDLESAVKHGKFREDLYYRLNVLRAKTPPLREHSDDIEALALTFLDRYVDDRHTKLRGYTKAALGALRAHSWPGNVRELLNRIRRAIVMCDGTMITPHDLGLDVETPDQPTLSLDAARFEAEKNTLLAALRKTGWNDTVSRPNPPAPSKSTHRLKWKSTPRPLPTACTNLPCTEFVCSDARGAATLFSFRVSSLRLAPVCRNPARISF